MIRHPGGVAFVVRRVSGVLLVLYFIVWLVDLPNHPLLPFGSSLARLGYGWSKALELLLIFVLSTHVMEGFFQWWVEKRHLQKQRGLALATGLVIALLIAGFHFLLFFGGPGRP